MQISLAAVFKILMKAYPCREISTHSSSNNEEVMWIYIDKTHYLMYNFTDTNLTVFESDLRDLFAFAKSQATDTYVSTRMSVQNDDNLFVEHSNECSDIKIDEIAYDV